MNTPKYSEHDLENETRLVRIEDKIDALDKRIDDALMAQVRDHGKRIAQLENWRMWCVGVAAGVGGAVSFLMQLFQR